jgi:hypothetical protein
MSIPFSLSILQIGDIMLYSTSDIVDELIEWKEADNVAHIEIYMGNNFSWASRNGIGINEYPTRLSGLVEVRQPSGIFDIADATQWFNNGVKGAPYGFGDILDVLGIKVDFLRGIDCSHFAAALCEVGNIPQFDSTYAKNTLTPSDFRKVRESVTVWNNK